MLTKEPELARSPPKRNHESPADSSKVSKVKEEAVLGLHWGSIQNTIG
jgi:hypothetical protein